MFTGIIEELGTVKDIKLSGSSGEIRIGAERVLENTRIGDSIAVNGVCLTVTRLSSDGFTADVMPDLERAMAADGRFGGHIVSGHIDGTGRIRDFKNEGNAVWVTIETGYDILKLVVEKGSIAVDGISLTVAEVTDSYFRVSVIPHTGSETALLGKHIGDPVNLETDIVGKYVAKLMGAKAGSASSGASSGGLTMEMLEEFML
jgi:riboflavin synthase